MFSVIFDMDGTLLDTQRIYIPAWENAGRLQGINGAGECVKYVCGMNELGWSAYILDKYKTIDLNKFKKDVNIYVEKNRVLRFKKGAEKLVQFLKESNVKVALATGTAKSVVMDNLEKLDALNMFDVIVGGDEVKNGKPAPDIFLLTAEKLFEKPENCIVFEDSENGLSAAINAGMKCIGVPDVAVFSEGIKEKTLTVLEDLGQAIEYFKKEEL